MIEKGADELDHELYSACYTNNMKIVGFLIKKDANNWNVGLTGACQGRHTKIIELMIGLGATDCDYCHNIEDHKTL